MLIKKGLLALIMTASFAQAADYEDWMGSAYSLTCKSGSKEVITTTKTNLVQEDDMEYVKSFEISAPKLVDGKQYKRNYVIKSVLVETKSSQHPIIVLGKHKSSNEQFRVELENMDSDAEGNKASTLYINDKEQDIKNLRCSIIFAG